MPEDVEKKIIISHHTTSMFFCNLLELKAAM